MKVSLLLLLPHLVKTYCIQNDCFCMVFLFQLEDLAIVPTSENPSLNTVECVLEGHDNFQGAKLGYQQGLDILCWLVFATSIVLAAVVFYSTKSWLGTDYEMNDGAGSEQPGFENEQKDQLKAHSLRWLFYILGLSEFVLAILALVLTIVYERGGFVYPLIFFCVTAVPPIALIVIVIRAICTDRKINTNLKIFDCCTFKMTAFDGLMMWSFFMTFHNLIWVLFGVVTEPTWGVPVLVVLFSICYCLFTLLYYNKRDMRESRCWGLFFSIVLLFALVCLFYGLGVVGQTFLNRDPISSFIASILVLVYSIWFNRFRKENKQQPNTTTNSSDSNN